MTRSSKLPQEFGKTGFVNKKKLIFNVYYIEAIINHPQTMSATKGGRGGFGNGWQSVTKGEGGHENADSHWQWGAKSSPYQYLCEQLIELHKYIYFFITHILSLFVIASEIKMLMKLGLAKCWQVLLRGDGSKTNTDITDKWGRRGLHMLTIAYKGGRGGQPIADNHWQKGEGGPGNPKYGGHNLLT